MNILEIKKKSQACVLESIVHKLETQFDVIEESLIDYRQKNKIEPEIIYNEEKNETHVKLKVDNKKWERVFQGNENLQIDFSDEDIIFLATKIHKINKFTLRIIAKQKKYDTIIMLSKLTDRFFIRTLKKGGKKHEV